MKIALLSRIVGTDPEAMRRLAEADIDVAIDLDGFESLGADRSEWLRIAGDIEGLVVGLQPVDAALFDAAPDLRHIVRVGTGVDNIDMSEAEARGVTVVALPGLNAEAVAEYAFGLLLAAARRIPEADASVRAGEWDRIPGRQLGGRTLGLLGFGSIARSMVPKAHGFGMSVIVHRRRSLNDASDGADVQFVSLDELLERSDFVSLHAPLTSETFHLIGARELDLMHGAILVNTARGELIDEGALCDALRTGRVAGCALDVFGSEPPTGSPLLDTSRVVLSPHNGGYGDIAMARTASAAVDALLEGLRSQTVRPGPTDVVAPERREP